MDAQPSAPASSSSPYSVPRVSEAGAAFFFKPRVILRMLEWFFALIAFATLASLNGVRYWDRGQFAIFTGVVSWVISMFLLINYAFGFRNKPIAWFELIFSAIWVILWFAAATALAVEKCYGGCSTYHASIAFSYFAFICYIPSSILAWFEIKGY